MWTPNAVPSLPSATLTEIADPIPDIPDNELHNTAALATLNSHPHLFKIVTPIRVDRFESLLESHPNQLFVMSICKGVTSECTALLGWRSGFGGGFGQWLQLVRCANLLAAGPSISIINIHEFGT